ncbi:MAG: hypothetical protein QM726_16640 [Chitinophagaceae bacterium]
MEEDIMVSGDGSLRLTNLRILFRTDNVTKEILLKDYESSCIRTEYIKVYKTRCIVAAILIAICILPYFILKNSEAAFMDIINSPYGILIGFLMLLIAFLAGLFLIFSIVLLLLSRRRFLEISSRLDTIIVPISAGNSSVYKFMKAIEKASGELKAVMQK